MRILFQIMIVLAIGLPVGALSAWYSIQRSHGIGAINIGEWTAWPFTGGGEADPYTVARIISDSTIPLGATEGLAFEATHDRDGQQLRLECSYLIEGTTPLARLWTLTPYRLNGQPILSNNSRLLTPQHTNSTKLVRFSDGSFRLSLSSNPAPGNWIALGGEGFFRLVLRLYDTPITSNAGLLDPVMPAIRRLECAS